MQKNKKFNFNIDEEPEVSGKSIKQIHEIPVDQLKHFHNHPFKVDQSRVEKLAIDIKQNGLISSIITRNQREGKYEILAGHHRFEAVKLCGFKTVRAEILENISEDEAQIIVTSSNFYQRSMSEMLPSELVKACTMFYNANKKQGKRNDLIKETSHQLEEKIDTRKFVGIEFGISPSTLDRNLRLSKLCDEFLGALDEGNISSAAGIYLSFLSLNEQKLLLNWIEHNRLTGKPWLSMDEAQEIKMLSQHTGVNEKTLPQVFNKENKKTFTKPIFKLKREIFNNYFSQEMTEEEIIAEIQDALKFYKQFKETGGFDGKFPQQAMNNDGSFYCVLKTMED